MSSASRRNPKSERQSLFFQDLSSPVSTHRGGGRLATSGRAAAVSALWKENFGGTEPPPPPVFTLEDRMEFSPEPAVGELPTSPELGSGSLTPKPSRVYFSSASPRKSRGEASGSGFENGVSQVMKSQQQQSPGSSSWWSPSRVAEMEKEKGGGSPVDGIVQPGALITLPPPREVVRPEMQKNSLLTGALDEEEWVTVYGFAVGDTNLVLREFEKCGTILKHVPGPRDANWMHILYQNSYDARRALARNGAQINSVLIVGVKPVDPLQRQCLNEKLEGGNHGGFVLPSFTPRTVYGRRSTVASAAPRRHGMPNGGVSNAVDGKGQHPTGSMASPAKSVVSKVMDLMFGI